MQELMNEERRYVQGTGIVYGKLVCLLKSVIGCGGFVEKVFTDEREITGASCSMSEQLLVM